MRFKDYFSNDFETTEDSHIKELRSRYYRASNETVKKAVFKFIEEEKAEIIDVQEQYNEIFFRGKNYTCIITVISPRISETAIDIKITTYKLLPFGLGKKLIERMYKYFDSVLSFKGVSLYRS